MTDMNCCATDDTSLRESGSGSVSKDFASQSCGNCASQSRPVSRKTVLLMLKPNLLEHAMTGTYGFCSARDCPVVYFEQQSNRRFTTDDLRLPVGIKAKTDPVPLCYCFGFNESHIREEISRTGYTTIRERISNLIREGLCACEARNPGGVCCLGEVNRAAKALAASERSSD